MSDTIIRFIPRPNHNREQTDFPTIVFRSPRYPDDLVMERADNEPGDTPSVCPVPE